MADEHLALTTGIVSAHVGHNSVHANELPGLIKSVYGALAALDRPPEPAPVSEERPTRAVSVRKSLASPDRIISMIDGKAYSLLTRHLKNNGYTPNSYREAYKLPSDYPMVAPAYAEKRREFARTIGLGRTKAVAAVEVAPEVVAPVLEKTRRGAKRAAATVADVAKPAAKRA